MKTHKIYRVKYLLKNGETYSRNIKASLKFIRAVIRDDKRIFKIKSFTIMEQIK